MKMICFLFWGLLYLPGCLWAIDQTETKVAKNDSTEIKEIIQKQIDAYRIRDLDVEMSLWAKSDDILKVTNQNKYIQGRKALRNYYATIFADPDFSGIGDWSTTTDDFKIIIADGSFAWVVHYQQDVYKRGWRMHISKSIQTRILKKIDGQWKIVFHQIANLPD